MAFFRIKWMPGFNISVKSVNKVLKLDCTVTQIEQYTTLIYNQNIMVRCYVSGFKIGENLFEISFNTDFNWLY